MTWFGVRTVFFLSWADAYEERVTVHRAQSFEEAIAAAEHEYREYAATLNMEWTGMSQAFEMADNLEDGAEVFSLIRRSSLDPDTYVDHFFSTGEEMEKIQPQDSDDSP